MIWCFLALCLAACGPMNPPASTFTAPALREPSGLVKSRRLPGVFWTHNDSGDSARIFAVTSDGRLMGTFSIAGAKAVDWEDIAVDDAGHLYIADCGNNDNTRKDLVIYRVPEPDPAKGARTASVDRTLRFHYPEQTAFPDPERKNFDAEAIFWAPHPITGEGTLYLLTKHRSDQRTTLYRFDDLSGVAEIALTRVGGFELGGDPGRFGGMVTAADATVGGRYLAVLTYHAIFVFERPAEGDDYLSALVNRIPLDQDVAVQAESIAWDGADLLFGNEQRRLFRVKDPLTTRDTYPR